MSRYPETPHEKPLNAQQRAFVDALLADPKRNATEAYLRVYNTKSRDAAGVGASKLMADPRVQALIEAKDEEIAQGGKLTREVLAEHLRQLVTADPRDLLYHYRGACRYCYGHQHRYQWTPGELERALEAYREGKKGPGDPMCLEFDYKGGVGFNPKKPAHPECPECYGEGAGYTYVKDMRTLPPEAARLYAGLKETKDGFEIKMRSQDKMVELALRANGMLTERASEGDDGNAPPVAVTYAEHDASDPEQEHMRHGTEGGK